VSRLGRLAGRADAAAVLNDLTGIALRLDAP
jgi:hypothetical protein